MNADLPVTDVDTGRPINPKTLGLCLLRPIDEEHLNCSPIVTVEPAWSRLYELGVRGLAINGRGPFDALGFDQVIFLDAGRFEFARYMPRAGAVGAVIIPATDEHGDLEDLGAWSIGENRLAMLRGAVPALGLGNLHLPRIDGPLAVHENVISWLRDDRRGLFIIDPQRAADRLRGHTLAVDSAAFGRRLADALTIEAPHIIMRKQRGAAA
jgi:hypothetical protein